MALSAGAGATIRYTLDGSTPTAASAAYSAPLSLDSTTTVKAVALHVDWTSSGVMAEAYTVVLPDTTPPTIVAVTRPAPNARGWHNEPATVSFTCTDQGVEMTNCPEPVTVSAEGEGQLVTRTVTDAAGNVGSASVTINLDSTPTETVITSPETGENTTESFVNLAVALTETLSGVWRVQCNGVVATMVGGGASCRVWLQPGRNTVLVNAMDKAGNSASDFVRIYRGGAPTRMSVSPRAVTILSNDRRSVTLRDEFFEPVPDATWASDNAAIVDVVIEDGVVMLVGAAAGTTVVTATAGTLEAEVSVTVVAGSALPLGTEQWRASPDAEREILRVLRADPTDSSRYDYLTQEWPTVEGAHPVIRGNR